MDYFGDTSLGWGGMEEAEVETFAEETLFSVDPQPLLLPGRD